MYEERRIRLALMRNALLFFAAFALIFGLLGAFIYHMISSSIFQTVDRQLLATGAGETVSFVVSPDDASTEPAGFEDGAGGSSESPHSGSSVEGHPASAGKQEPFILTEDGIEGSASDFTISSQGLEYLLSESPQTVFILRAPDGSSLGVSGLYGSYPSLLDSLPANPSVFNEVYTLGAEGKQYRALNHALHEEHGDPNYLQAVINVDSEMAILEQSTRALIMGLALALLVSAGASCLLSRRTVRPIAEAWKAQTTFIQNASHELRTPLTVIRATQELLLESPRDRIIDHFEDINLTLEESGRLSRLTRDLLAISVSDTGATPKLEVVDLDKHIKEAAAGYEELAKAQGRDFSFICAENIRFRADGAQIRRMLDSIIENAFKYTETDDEIAVAASVCEKRVVIEVKDTGVGIADEDMNQVFKRFYRADKARSRTTEGAGLGLSIAQEIALAHQGTISLAHNHPRGVCVRVELPLSLTL